LGFQIFSFRFLLFVPHAVILGLGWKYQCHPGNQIHVYLLVTAIVWFVEFCYWFNVPSKYSSERTSRKFFKSTSGWIYTGLFLFFMAIELGLEEWGISILVDFKECVHPDGTYTSESKHMKNMVLSDVIIMMIVYFFGAWISYSSPDVRGIVA